jgi:desulfoferrodoxin
MKRLKENTTDAAKEKHVPVVEKTHDRYKVMVGEVAHPMEKKDHIEWLELIIARMERIIANSCGPGSHRKRYST